MDNPPDIHIIITDHFLVETPSKDSMELLSNICLEIDVSPEVQADLVSLPLFGYNDRIKSVVLRREVTNENLKTVLNGLC